MVNHSLPLQWVCTGMDSMWQSSTSTVEGTPRNKIWLTPRSVSLSISHLVPMSYSRTQKVWSFWPHQALTALSWRALCWLSVLCPSHVNLWIEGTADVLRPWSGSVLSRYCRAHSGAKLDLGTRKKPWEMAGTATTPIWKAQDENTGPYAREHIAAIHHKCTHSLVI